MLFKGIVFAIFLVLINNAALAASFDCKKASSSIEEEICSDVQISKADDNLANYYLKLMNSLDKKRARELLHEQREWLRQRNILCAARDLLCLRKLYNDRISVLRTRYENIVPFELDNSNGFQGMRGTCEFNDVKFPAEYSIYAAGWYAGRELDVQIDQSGEEAGRFDIIVNSPGKPVVLILGAYEPSIWNIGWTKETVILAVVATGYHRQAVAGIPKDTPILISTSSNGGLCGNIYPNGQNQKKIDGFSNRLFGKPTDKIYLVGAGKAILGLPLKPEEQFVTSADVTIESFIDRKAPLAGAAGLKDALRKGLLRLATQYDREEWIIEKAKEVYTKSRKQPKNPFCAGIVPLRPARADESYTILKPFRLPKGLSGGTFFLLKGVPFPEGDLGGCELYDFNTMKCHGYYCNQPDCY